MNGTLTERLLRDTEVGEMLGISARTVSRWSRLGDLPQPIIITHGSTRWVESEIVKWIREKQSQRLGHKVEIPDWLEDKTYERTQHAKIREEINKEYGRGERVDLN